MNWSAISARILEGGAIERAEALALLASTAAELPAVLGAAFAVRERYFGRRVNLHVLNNAKSGLCTEDCAFCSQSAVSAAPVARYALKSVEEIIAGAQAAARLGAVKYCIVLSGRAPAPDEFAVLCAALTRIKAETAIHLCVSPGLLTEAQAVALKQAGADRINHNLETSRRFYAHIVSAHTYDDRLATLHNARRAGLQLCCGGLIGMGEEPEDRVDLAFTLRELAPESIPVNFFNPRPGTPLADRPPLGAADCLRALAMFRLVNPRSDIRAAGGRETNLGPLQGLAFNAASSIFTQGYLTTSGQGYEQDVALIQAEGFEIGSLEA